MNRSLQNKAARDLSIIAAAVLIVQIPFLDKPFHIDDTVTLKSAAQVLRHPLRPYDFTINWYGTELPQFNSAKNPPLNFYYAAAAIRLFGASERALHLCYIPFALAAAFFVYMLARRVVRWPLIWTLWFVATPCFAVSATSLMLDVQMLVYFAGSVACFCAAAERRSWALAILAGVLGGLAAVTKYNALSLFPLFIVGALVWGHNDRQRAKLLLAPPMLMLVPFLLWCLHGWIFWGTPHFVDASHYMWAERMRPRPLALQFIAFFSFASGCVLLPILAMLRGLQGERAVCAAAVCAGVVMALIARGLDAGYSAVHCVVVAAFVSSSVWGLATALRTALRMGTPTGWMLGLWLAGFAVFDAFLAWTVAGRFILPLAPVLVILLGRWWEERFPKSRHLAAVGWAAAMLVSLCLCRADMRHAQAHRGFARMVLAQYGHKPGRLFFTGNWGFQYYMEKGGARALDVCRPAIRPGDWLVVPSLASNPDPPPELKPFLKKQDRTLVRNSAVHLMNPLVRAGYYSHRWGLLPYWVAPRVPNEVFTVYAVAARRE